MNVPIWEVGQNKKPFETREGRKQASINLLDIFTLAEYCGVNLYLIFGTLLGYVRDNNFIYWDDDIDLAGLLEEREKIENYLEVLREEGYYIPKEGMPPYDTVFIKDGVKIEIWWFEDIGEEYCYYPENNPTYKFKKSFFIPKRPVQFRGVNVNIPNNPEEFLDRAYTNWRVPDKKQHGVL